MVERQFVVKGGLTIANSDTITYGGVTLSNSVTGTGSIVLSTSPTITGNLTISYIKANSALGSSQALLSNSTGGVYWGSAGSVGGANTNIQFNDSGVANGTTAFVFDKSSNTVTITGALSLTSANVNTLNNVLYVSEKVTINSTAAANATVNYDITAQSVLYYSVNATTNWTVNFRGSSSNTLNNTMQIGQIITAAMLVRQGATPYYNNLIKIDNANTTARWQGGTPTAGSANSTDSYTYTIIKTANTTFDVLASLSSFAV